MKEALGSLRHPGTWTLSVQLLVLYCVAVALFFAVAKANRSVAGALKDGVRAGRVGSRAGVFLATAATNALGVFAFTLLCRKLGETPRLAMIALPLFLVMEEQIRALRSAAEDRAADALLALGTAVGLIGAAAALLRGAPLH